MDNEFVGWLLADIADQAQEVGYLTPIEYARLNKIRPQTVYRWIREKKLTLEYCKCGRRVVSVQEADEVQEASRARRRGLDTREDSGTSAVEGPVVSKRREEEGVEAAHDNV